MNRRDRQNLLSGLAFTAPWLFGLSVFTLYPVLASLYYSFCDYSVLQPALWTGGDNYVRLVHDELFWRSLGNTLFFAALSIPLGTVVSLALALLLNQEVPGTPLFRTIFYLPAIVPVVASSMLWMWIFNGSYGLLNYALAPVLRWLHTTAPAWLSDPSWAKPALVLMSVWGVGNSMVIYLAGLKDVPKELYEAAEIDGASALRRFWHVTLPMLTPVIYFNVVMGIIGALQTFTQAFVMMGADGPPARSTLFYALYLFTTAFYDLRMGYASAMAWVLFVVIVALTIIATKWFGKRMQYGR